MLRASPSVCRTNRSLAGKNIINIPSHKMSWNVRSRPPFENKSMYMQFPFYVSIIQYLYNIITGHIQKKLHPQGVPFEVILKLANWMETSKVGGIYLPIKPGSCHVTMNECISSKNRVLFSVYIVLMEASITRMNCLLLVGSPKFTLCHQVCCHVMCFLKWYLFIWRSLGISGYVGSTPQPIKSGKWRSMKEPYLNQIMIWLLVHKMSTQSIA